MVLGKFQWLRRLMASPFEGFSGFAVSMFQWLAPFLRRNELRLYKRLSAFQPFSLQAFSPFLPIVN